MPEPEGFDLPEMFDADDAEPMAAVVNAGIDAAPQPGEYATIRVTGGGEYFLPIGRDEAGGVIPQSIMEAAVAQGLTIPPGAQFWVEGSMVPGETHLAPGMIVTALGNVKGGVAHVSR